jgi:uncharacterized protein (TIGR00369 family)
MISRPSSDDNRRRRRSAGRRARSVALRLAWRLARTACRLEEAIELAFTATEAFTNPMGNVLGAFVAAMLYDTVGPALLATLAPDQFQSTLELNVNFLRPVRPGRLVGKGRVVHRDGDMAFIEASLLDAQGALIATATATAGIIAFDRARSAA